MPQFPEPEQRVEPTDSRIPRLMEEPTARAAAVALFKAGLSMAEVTSNLGVNQHAITREWDHDPAFYRACLDAMSDPYDSAFRKALALSEEADVAGENKGAHNALGLVMRSYDRWLDRTTELRIKTRALNQAEQQASVGSSGSLVLGRGGVEKLIEYIEDNKPGAIETTGTPKDEET